MRSKGVARLSGPLNISREREKKREKRKDKKGRRVMHAIQYCAIHYDTVQQI